MELQFITHYTDRYSYFDSACMALKGGCRWIQLRMKDAFWGQIFCLLSAGGATIETIRQYIESQGEKNEPRRKNKDLSK